MSKNVNLASAEALQAVLTERLAENLVKEREANGRFESWDVLAKRVKGLGKRKADALQDAGFTLGGKSAVALAVKEQPESKKASGKARRNSRSPAGRSPGRPKSRSPARRSPGRRKSRSPANRDPRVAADAWYGQRNDGYPPEFRVGLKDLPESVGRNIRWGGKDYTAREFDVQIRNWDEAYPSLTAGGGKHPSESVSERNSATTDKDNKHYCWLQMKTISFPDGKLSSTTRKKLYSTFRLDAFGNIVSEQADSMAICKFEVDHIFPFAKGGRSVRDNLWGMYWGANRVKRENLLQTFTPTNSKRRGLFMGLREEQLIALFVFLELDSASRKRNTQSFIISAVIDWLIKFPPTGQSIKDVAEWTGGSTDGKTLYGLLKKRNEEQSAAMPSVGPELSIVTQGLRNLSIRDSKTSPTAAQRVREAKASGRLVRFRDDDGNIMWIPADYCD